jgi:phosphate transport system permease protein
VSQAPLPPPDPSPVEIRRKRRKLLDRSFHLLVILAIVIAVAVLCTLLVDIWRDGVGRVTWAFLTNPPSRFWQKAGILPALLGSFYVILLTAVIAIPLGSATGVYLEFYAPASKLSRLIQVNIANLAGVPSIVYGLFGLAFFVRFLNFDRSILSAALTMALLILPVIIVNTQEALRAIPPSLAHGAYALGASKWQVVWTVVLPAAVGGIFTGSILAISRALGESAPLIAVGAWVFITALPRSPLDSFTVLPIQIWYWSGQPQDGFKSTAAAAIIVLLVVLLTINGIAIFLRNRYQKKAEW